VIGQSQGALFDHAARAARVVDVFWGDPDARVVRRIHEGGALAFWQVGSLGEALAAVAAGCDAVVVQGVEAGGHVRGTTPLLDLLSQVTVAIDVPVIAAGGITTGRAMADALCAGASAVRIGTRLVATAEADAHRAYIDALLRAGDGDTVLCTAFSAGWEDAPHRVLRSAYDACEKCTDDVVGAMVFGDRRLDIPRRFVGPPLRCATGHIDAMAMYAGTGVSAITDVPPAATVIQRMVTEAHDLL